MEHRALYSAENRNRSFLQYAYCIQMKFESGQAVPEPTVAGVFEYLSYRFLSRKARNVNKKVSVFYRAQNANVNELVKDSNRIAYFLYTIPFVNAIIPAGQLYCDGYNPLNRRFLGLMDFLSKEKDEFSYLRQDLPDYDLISVFDLEVDEFWPLKPTGHFDRQLFFKKKLEKWSGWDTLVVNLKESFRLKKHPIGAIKLTGDPSERINTVSDFMNDNAIALCFSHHMPTSFYNHLDLMVCDDDYQRLSFIRDLIIGCDPPIVAKPIIRTDIGKEFQINYLLYQTGKTGSQNIYNLMRTAFNTVARTMPDRPRHSASTGLINYSKKRWKTAFNEAKRLKLIEKCDETNYKLTSVGQIRLKNILERRESYLDQGCLTSESD